MIQGQRIHRNRLNYSEMEGSDVYTETSRLTSVKMEEPVSLGAEKVTSDKSSKISHETAFNTTCYLSLPHHSTCHLSHPLLHETGPGVNNWAPAPFPSRHGVSMAPFYVKKGVVAPFSVMKWVLKLLCVKKQALAPFLCQEVTTSTFYFLSWSTGTFFYVKKWWMALF